MSSNLIQQPYPIILNPHGGGGSAKPAANAEYHVGEIDKDPVQYPRTDLAYKDEGGTERLITSPIYTNNSGAFVASENSGTIIQPYMKNGLGYSVLIKGRRGVIYESKNTGDPGNVSGAVLGDIGRVLDGDVFPYSEYFASAGDTVPSGTLFLKTKDTIKWIALIDELPALPQEIASITDYEVTFTNGYSSPLLPLTARFTNEVTFEMFGANRNSVILPNPLRYAINPTLTPIVNSSSDDLDAINKCIAYCAPYEFVTDIKTTRALMGNVRAKIVGNGNFRVTDSVKINPFLCIEGDKKGGFFGENGGLNIYGDFDDKAKYILDTAPMFAGGDRPLGETYQRNDFDSGSTPGCPGWSISKLGVNALPGRAIKGALNRQIAQQSRVTDCALGTYWQRCYEGIKSSVCWGGVVSDNHIRGSAYSIRNENDITTDLQQNNYLTVSGTKPSTRDYTYVNWPNADLQDKTACIVNRYADPHMRDNTCEGAEIGAQSFGSQFTVRDDGNYYEKIKEYIYGLHTVNAELKPKWIFCDDAELISVRGGSLNLITLDLTSTSSLSVKGFGSCESFVSRGVKVLGSARVYDLPYNSRFHLHDAEIDGVLSIYVDNVGDDANIGYSVQNSVQTIQEALGRCKKGVSNVINIIPGEVVNTKYQLGSGTVTNTVLSGLDISFVSDGTATIDVGSSSGQTHCIPMDSGTLTFDGVDVKLTNSATAGDYRSFFRTLGNIDFNLKDMQIYGASGNAIFGAQYGKGGHCRISMNTVTLGSNLDFTHSSGETKGFSWIETSSRVTNNGTSVGTGSTGKIFSTTF